MLDPKRGINRDHNVYAEIACGIHVGNHVASELQLGRDTHVGAFLHRYHELAPRTSVSSP